MSLKCHWLLNLKHNMFKSILEISYLEPIKLKIVLNHLLTKLLPICPSVWSTSLNLLLYTKEHWIKNKKLCKAVLNLPLMPYVWIVVGMFQLKVSSASTIDCVLISSHQRIRTDSMKFDTSFWFSIRVRFEVDCLPFDEKSKREHVSVN